MVSNLRAMFAAALLVGALLPLTATADLIPPDADACDGKSAGDPCQINGVEDGLCTTSTCSKLDYTDGTPPKSVEYECLRCEPAESEPSTNSGTTSGTESGDTTTGDETTPTDGSTNSKPSEESSGCSVSTHARPMTTVSFLAGALLFGGLLRRRSRR